MSWIRGLSPLQLIRVMPGISQLLVLPAQAAHHGGSLWLAFPAVPCWCQGFFVGCRSRWCQGCARFSSHGKSKSQNPLPQTERNQLFLNVTTRFHALSGFPLCPPFPIPLSFSLYHTENRCWIRAASPKFIYMVR